MRSGKRFAVSGKMPWVSRAYVRSCVRSFRDHALRKHAHTETGWERLKEIRGKIRRLRSGKGETEKR
jgi:hypothetical protein